MECRGLEPNQVTLSISPSCCLSVILFLLAFLHSMTVLSGRAIGHFQVNPQMSHIFGRCFFWIHSSTKHGIIGKVDLPPKHHVVWDEVSALMHT